MLDLSKDRENSVIFCLKKQEKTRKKMFKREGQQDISATKSKKLKKERSVDEAKIEIINDLLDKIKEE